jgi:hypothetical protein
MFQVGRLSFFNNTARAAASCWNPGYDKGLGFMATQAVAFPYDPQGAGDCDVVLDPTGAAASLGIPRSTLESKIRSLKIDKNRFKAWRKRFSSASDPLVIFRHLAKTRQPATY